MILLCGIPTEAPMRLVIAAAEARGVPHLVLNQRRLGHADLALERRGEALGGTLRWQERSCDLESVDGVYLRLMDWAALPELEPRRTRAEPEQTTTRIAWLQELLVEWMEAAPCSVMNRARAMASNLSKPYQAQLIRRVGFAVPPTLITNDPEAALRFRRLHGRVIYKSISSVRSIVRELGEDDLDRLGRLRALPTQFQALVEGTDVRVHVAGDAVFATEIRSRAVDYRYAGEEGEAVEMAPVQLPDSVADRCLRLARSLRLPLCGIDLRRTAAGTASEHYTCFEVNPCPAFSYYQEATGQPIADAIVSHLAARGSRPRLHRL